MTTPSRYDQFKAAFNDVEDHLKTTLNGEKSLEDPIRFARALKDYRKKFPRRLRASDYDLLLDLADVRNILTHTRYITEKRPADPTDEGVSAIRQVRDRLLSPATAYEVLNRKAPLTVEPSTTVGTALAQMHEHDFSQLPVYEDKRTYRGLLTTNAVARWVGLQLSSSDGFAVDAPVSDVLAFTEDDERVRHVPKSISATEALGYFREGVEKGEPLTALLITANGKTSETPLAIVVAADLPALVRA